MFIRWYSLIVPVNEAQCFLYTLCTTGGPVRNLNYNQKKLTIVLSLFFSSL